AHFWLANLGLLGMIVTRALGAAGMGGAALRVFPLFALMTALGAWLFVWNLFPLLLEKRVARADGRATPRMRVSEILARWPESLPVFREWGFAALANPAARATFAKLVTLEKACRIHKVDTAEFLSALNGSLGGAGIPLPVLETGRDEGGSGSRGSAPLAGGDRAVGGEVKVGDLIRAHPVARGVLEGFFGPDCFSCPGQVQETLAQSASLHGVDPDTLLDAVNDALGGAGKGAPDRAVR
ncbi:MAG: DUF1858 domain-containing protein, partial [Myxococcota bacterium]